MTELKLNQFEIKPGTIDNSNLLDFLVVAGPTFLTQVSEDHLGYRPANVVLEHPGTGHTTNATVYIKA